MTAKLMIKKLRKYPPQLEVLAFASGPEQSGFIEGLRGFHTFEARFGHYLDGIRVPGIECDAFAFAQVWTGMPQGLTVEETIRELSRLDSELPIAFHPNGLTMADRYVEVAEVIVDKFGIFKENFHDMMDYTDYAADIYFPDHKNGTTKLLFWGEKAHECAHIIYPRKKGR
jgi:hypothetical protein